MRASNSPILARGTLPAASQRSAMSSQALRAASMSLIGRSFSASARISSFFSALTSYSASSCGVGLVARCEERVLRRPEPLPELVLDVAGCGAGLLPLRHQVAILAGGRAPVGRRRQRLGLDDQLLLDRLGVLAQRRLLAEVRLATTRVCRAGRAEAVPQLVVGGLAEPGERLPLVEQGAELVGAGLPVVACGDLLGLVGDARLLGLRLGDLGGALGLALLALLVDRRLQGVEPLEQRVEIAQRLGVDDLRAHLGDGLGRVVRGERTTLQALLEQVDLDLESFVAAHVQRHRLSGVTAGPLADQSFAVSGLDVDIAFVVDTTPRVRGRRTHGATV